jgi:hypothetical protein
MNYIVKDEVKDIQIPCERYSRTSGYFATYANLNPGKKSERDERVYYRIPEGLNV